MTTLEILVTVAIAGVFASMAVMNMDVVKRRQAERNALREISVLANQARSFARTSQHPVRISVTTNAVGRKVMRWEQLPCDSANRWGDSCPVQSCYTNACGKGGCECVDQGESISLPATLDVTALNGLCWLGQGGAARYQPQGSATCQRNGDPPAKPLRIIQTETGKLDHILQVDGLTGKPRMVDCTLQSPDPACAIL